MRCRFLILLILLACPQARAESAKVDPLAKARESMVEVKTSYAKTMHTKKGKNRPRQRAVFERAGAGIIIDPCGLIATATHIIVHAPSILVILPNGKELTAKVAKTVPGYDLSFLRVRPSKPLKAIEWTDTSRVRAGDRVITVGNAKPDKQMPLSGHVLGFLSGTTPGKKEFLKMDLALYRGDSGAGVFDTKGRLLGIITAKSKNEDHASFAIAADKIREQYLKYRRNMP